MIEFLFSYIKIINTKKKLEGWLCSNCDKSMKKKKPEKIIETPDEIIVNVTNRNSSPEILRDNDGYIISPRACEKHRYLL